MATKFPDASAFMNKLLAPLPADVEQVDTKAFRRSIEADADKALSMAIAKADHQKSLAEVYHCETMIIFAAEGEQARVARLPHHNYLWNSYRAMVLVVAKTPALTKNQIVRKRRAIGRIWLHPDTGGNEFYEALRAGVAADELRMATPRRPDRVISGSN